MLAPPNGGSCVARRFRGLHFPISTVFARIYGKAGVAPGLLHRCLPHSCTTGMLRTLQLLRRTVDECWSAHV